MTKLHNEDNLNSAGHLDSIVLGCGCFWCAEAVFNRVRGIIDVQNGYSNGQILRPTYEQVCTGTTGHNEVVRLMFDPVILSLTEILEIFFSIHDPTTLNRQGHDVGTQYRSGIYFHTPEQKQAADGFITKMVHHKMAPHPITTEVLAVDNYWPAEDYHQNYFAKNPLQGYCAAVVWPKVAKFRKTFERLLKPE